MKGRIKNIIRDRLYGFIRTESGVEYFFHADDFRGNFRTLTAEMELSSRPVLVEFEPKETAKGPRATEIMLIANPS